jgi:flagellar hook-associated protein 2
MTITSLGVGSGLDAESIVQKLVAVQRQPISDLQSAKSDLDSEVSSYGKVQSYLSGLQDAARKLTDLSTWRATTVNSSDTTSITATVADGSAAANYSITVDHLAAAQSAASGAFASSGSSVGQGTLTITLGQWAADNSSFTAKSGASPVTVTIGPDDDTLAKIAAKINGAGAGVQASVVTDASGARLSIRSKDSGVENAFQITATNAVDGSGNPIGNLGALAYDPAGGAAGMTRTQQAVNALASINGLPIDSASNTLSNVLDGLTVNLIKPTTTPVEVSVASDTDAIKNAVTAFAQAFNDTMTYLRAQTKYDPDTKKAGTLQGDRTAINLMSQLRNLAGGNGGNSSVFSRLTDIGLEPQKDGTLKVDSAALGKAVGNLDELKKALANLDDATPANNGLGQKFKSYLDGMLDDSGAIETVTDSLQARIKDNLAQQDRLNDRADAYEKRIRAQYQALDAQMGQLQGLSDYVSQQLKLLG